jgi:hypothetical protein
MGLAAAAARAEDLVAEALVAAEMCEAFDSAMLPLTELREFFAAVPALRASVPVATQRLLVRLRHDRRSEVRMAAARAMQSPSKPRRSPPPPLSR